MNDVSATKDLHHTPRIGIVVRDTINCRLLESAAIHLQLEPVVRRQEDIGTEALLKMEIIIAEEPAAREIQDVLRAAGRADDPYRPAILAVIPAGFNINDEEVSKLFDGVLPMPQLPDALAAQLSVALYSHRAFARRYGDALDELQWNRRMFRSVASGITVSDAREPDFPLVYVNPSFEAITGYSLEESRGKNCRFLQGEDHDQPGLTLVREALRERRGTTAVLRNYRKDGKMFWNELTLSPVRGAQGEVTHYLGIQADITERIKVEMALRESEKLAVTGRLAAAIAHEINNPLESITNLVYLADRTEDLGEVRQYLGMVDQELRRIKLITSQSLRFARQSSRPQAVNCSELLDSVLDIQKARMTSVRVVPERRYRFPESIVCMENEIRQVLNNLVTNATDAMRSKGGTLHVRTRQATDWKTDRTGVLLTIADHGVGMSRQVLGKIFQAFYSTKGNRGTGLGLWISGEIVERHHGRLLVRSRDQGTRTGTVFQLFLPFQGVAGNLSGSPG